jgi:hypothetical protein
MAVLHNVQNGRAVRERGESAASEARHGHIANHFALRAPSHVHFDLGDVRSVKETSICKQTCATMKTHIYAGTPKRTWRQF